MKKTCWSCLGGRDSQESKPRETNCDSNSASAQSKESKSETVPKQQIKKPNSQQNNSKAQAKTLTHCYAYSSFLWGLEMARKRAKYYLAESLLIQRRKSPLLKCQTTIHNNICKPRCAMFELLRQEIKSGLQFCNYLVICLLYW